MQNDYYPNVVENIIKKMDGAPMQRLWDATSIPQPRGSRCMNGKDRFTLDQMCAIADYFNCPMDELLGRTSMNVPSEGAAAVCNFIAHMAKEKMLSFTSVPAEEEKYMISPEGWLLDAGKSNVKYTSLFFSNNPQHIPVDIGDGVDSAAGKAITTSWTINRFLDQLIQIYTPYINGIMDKDVFQIALDALLQKIE